MTTDASGFDPGQLHYTHPTLFRAPHRQTLPYKTLSSLGLKSSAQAREAGFICVKPHSTNGSKAFPGLWLAPDELPLLQAAFEKERSKAPRQGRPREAKPAPSTAVRPRVPHEKLYRALCDLTGLSQEMLKEHLPQSWLCTLSPATQKANATPAQVLLSLARPTWRHLQGCGVNCDFYLQGIRVTPSGQKLFSAIVMGDARGIEEALDAQLQRLERKVQHLLEKWNPSRPCWFSEGALRAFAVDAVNGKPLEHPLDATYLSLKQFKQGIPLAYKGVRVLVAFERAFWLKWLWGQPHLKVNTVVSLIQSKAQEDIASTIEEDLARFIKEHDPKHTWGVSGSPAAWQTMCTSAYLAALVQQGTAKELFAPGVLRASAEKQLLKILENERLQQSVQLCQEELPKELKGFYPLARKLQRRLTFIMGPTNSGKTYQALKHLKEANSGVYLGPLRLLALEVHEKLIEEGVASSLITGELVIKNPDAHHSASTIEMLNLREVVEVAVIDEVQMLCDPDRGSAWLQAILGAPARHVVLVGSPAALPLIRKLAQHTGEALETVELTRLSPLHVMRHPTSLHDLKHGTALIVFSRREALDLATHLRERHHYSVAVIYGALSPEVRQEQARLFREGQAQILVATDAIGMGLNLPIRTVLFTTTEKWNGQETVQLDTALLQQIAGRAGRYGLHEKGEVGAFDEKSLRTVTKRMNQTLRTLPEEVGVPLNFGIAHTIARHTGKEALEGILLFFIQNLSWERWACPAVTEDQRTMARYLDRFVLSLPQKLRLLNAPAYHKEQLDPRFPQMVLAVQQQMPCELNLSADRRSSNLEDLEGLVRCATLYCWMHYRFPELFPKLPETLEHLSELNLAIARALQHSSGKRCRDCGTRLRWNVPHALCDACYHAGGRRAI